MLLARRGWPEEAWFTFSLSAVGCGGVGRGRGVLRVHRDHRPGDRRAAAARAGRARRAGQRHRRGGGGRRRRRRARRATAPTCPPRCCTCATTSTAGPVWWPPRASCRAGPSRRRPSTATASGRRSCTRCWRPAAARSSPAWPPRCPTGGSRGAGPLRPGLLGGDRHDEAPFDTAVVLPVGTGVGRPAGVLVAGVSAYLPLDDEYRAFLELVGHHVSTATVAAGAFAAQQRRAEHLTELDRTKTAFFAGISDQFRTPLTLVLGPVAELRDAAAPGSALRADLELVHRNAQRLRRMVDRLLELSRLYAGQVDPHLEPVDLAPLTAGLVDMFRPAIEHAGLSLDLDCPDLGEPAVVDRAMWEQVVPALLAHALAVASDGRITVTAPPRGTAPRCCASPRPARPGCEPEDGGVGLALVAELVGLLGGSVTTDAVTTGRTGAGFAVDVAVPLGRDHLPAAGISGNHPELRAESVAEALWWLPDAGDPPVGSPPVPDRRPRRGADPGGRRPRGHARLPRAAPRPHAPRRGRRGRGGRAGDGGGRPAGPRPRRRLPSRAERPRAAHRAARGPAHVARAGRAHVGTRRARGRRRGAGGRRGRLPGHPVLRP